MSVRCKIVPVTAYQQNCSILICSETSKAAIVDPGGDLDRILAILEQEGGELEKIFITHGHLDHCSGTKELAQRTGVPVEGPHTGDKFWIDGIPEACQMAGFPPAQPFEPDRWLDEGDTIEFGTQKLQVLHCPGHTPGHLVFYHAGIRVAWVGDVLFQGSIGRTDFPGGDHDTLVASIREKLWPLGDEVQFVPGHGPMSTFGEERRTNGFVADSRFG
jgi:glyoxylase-like metal-dependent hydrolase (beta-lactamase superfamily II)